MGKEPEKRTGSKLKVLVVDDEWALRQLLSNALVLSGFEVLTAADEAEFRKLVMTEKPDAIILDIMLGKADGTEIYNQLITEGLDADIPVVFLSALAQDVSPTPPRRGRKYSLIGKPFDPEMLVQQLTGMLQA